MRPISTLCRATGLLAAGGLVAASTVLGAAGVAQAAVEATGFDPDSDVQGEWTVPDDGTCLITWVITGARGGDDDQGAPAATPDERTVTTMVSAGDVFVLAPGSGGADAPATTAGTNTEGAGAFDGGAGNGTTGGGGGAASVIMQDDHVYLWVDGTAGAGAGGGVAGTVTTEPGTGNFDPDSTDTTAPTASAGPDGRITGTGYTCDNGGGGEEPPADAPPYAPEIANTVDGDGRLVVWFTENYADGVPPVTDWEYRLDGGAWTPFEPEHDPWSMQMSLTVTGLTNGETYTVGLRGINEVGEGAEATTTGTPYEPIGALQDIDVSTAPSALDISWGTPTEDGTFALAGYKVLVVWEGEQAGGAYEPCDTDATTFECYAGVPAGDDYVVHVVAIDSEGNDGDTSGGIRTGVVPLPDVPASVPEADAPLEGVAAGAALTAGDSVTVSGDGFLPNSTIQAVIYSTPTLLGAFAVDEAGAFEIDVTIPDDLDAGEHSLVVSGLDANGNPRNLRVDVTVAAATEELPWTGASVAGPAIGGLAALVVGSGLLVASRRRSPA